MAMIKLGKMYKTYYFCTFIYIEIKQGSVYKKYGKVVAKVTRCYF